MCHIPRTRCPSVNHTNLHWTIITAYSPEKQVVLLQSTKWSCSLFLCISCSFVINNLCDSVVGDQSSSHLVQWMKLHAIHVLPQLPASQEFPLFHFISWQKHQACIRSFCSINYRISVTHIQTNTRQGIRRSVQFMPQKTTWHFTQPGSSLKSYFLMFALNRQDVV